MKQTLQQLEQDFIDKTDVVEHKFEYANHKNFASKKQANFVLQSIRRLHSTHD